MVCQLLFLIYKLNIVDIIIEEIHFYTLTVFWEMLILKREIKISEIILGVSFCFYFLFNSFAFYASFYHLN